MKEQPLAAKTIHEVLPLRLAEPEKLFERMQQIYDSIARRAFEIFEGKGGTFGHDLDDWFEAESEILHPARVEVQESDDALIVCAEVPGFCAKELEVSVEPRRVTVRGQKEASDERKKGKTLYTERRSDQIFRVLDLPVEVDPFKTTATLKDGMLELKMPRASKVRKIRVEPKAA